MSASNALYYALYVVDGTRYDLKRMFARNTYCLHILLVIVGGYFGGQTYSYACLYILIKFLNDFSIYEYIYIYITNDILWHFFCY